MTRRFTWDPEKAEENLRKHGVSFEEATEAFEDPLAVAFRDVPHSWEEERFGTIGATFNGRLIKVTYTIREEDIHIINARRPIPFERRRYMDSNEIHEEPTPEFDDDEIDTTKVDWSKAVRGGIHHVPRRTGTVTLAEDVFLIFQTDDEVNTALRMLIKENRIPHFPLGGHH